jgi:hypothetical protein
MGAVQTFKQCEQCGFPEADYIDYYRSGEWFLICRRCGYHEEWKHESYLSNGRFEKATHTVMRSAGAYCAQDPETGIRQCGSVVEAELQEVTARMRDDIASGKLSSESYVTRYDFLTGEVTALVGQVPTPCPDQDTRSEAAYRKSQTTPKEEDSMSTHFLFFSRLMNALSLAVDLRDSSTKGTNIAYIAELMSVCAIVLKNGGDENLAIAALLRDAADDQDEGPPPEMTRSLFGDRVAEVLVECSGTHQVPKPSWRERKEAYLVHLRTASADVRLISAADKLSNLRNILADLWQLKEVPEGRFDAEDQSWFYHSVISALTVC